MSFEFLKTPVLNVHRPEELHFKRSLHPEGGRNLQFQISQVFARYKTQPGKKLRLEFIQAPDIDRGKGFGKMLIQAGINYCIRHKINTLTGTIVPIDGDREGLITEVSYEQLCKFYSSCGFDIRGDYEIEMFDIAKKFSQNVSGVI